METLYVHSAKFIQRIKHELSLYFDIITFVNNLRDSELDQMILNYHSFMLEYGKSNQLNYCNIPNYIKLIWRIHLLHPGDYLQDCIKHFHHIIDPQHFIFEFKSAHHSFFIFEFNNNKTDKFTDINLKQSLMNQICFMTNIICDIEFYKNDNTIKQTINEYIQFMTLIGDVSADKSHKTMIPSVPIDLIWHTHMLHPLIYYKESHILANTLVDHNDFLKDECQEKYLNDFRNTKKEWNKKFGENKSSQIYVNDRDFVDMNMNTGEKPNVSSNYCSNYIYGIVIIFMGAYFLCLYVFSGRFRSLDHHSYRRRLASVNNEIAISVIVSILVVVISICIVVKFTIYDKMCQFEGCLVVLDDYQVYYHRSKSFPDGLMPPNNDKNAGNINNESSIIYKQEIPVRFANK